MNERIQELIYKADEVEIHPDKDFCDTDFLADIDPRRVKVFAKMIAEECASLFPHQFTDEQYSRRIDKTIRKHFGIEQ